MSNNSADSFADYFIPDHLSEREKFRRNIATTDRFFGRLCEQVRFQARQPFSAEHKAAWLEARRHLSTWKDILTLRMQMLARQRERALRLPAHTASQTAKRAQRLAVFDADLEEDTGLLLRRAEQAQQTLAIAEVIAGHSPSVSEALTPESRESALTELGATLSFFLQGDEDLKVKLSHDEIVIWAASLLGLTGHKVRVPFATYKSGAAAIFYLELETLDNTFGRISYDPTGHFTIYQLLTPDFRQAIGDAWAIAFQQLREGVPHPAAAAKDDVEGGGLTTEKLQRLGGRWRIMADNEPVGFEDIPAEGIEGGSAGGAAALGWYHALRGSYPDREVIVFAAISDDRKSFAEVAGVSHKTRAVVEAGRFDTILVAGEENRRQAQRALNPSNNIRVVLPSELET